ncbi:bifunctional [glutamate--ammonia ligase]-adenylyl-L-tyrosine phosphorylase/[glutamate--ammonia-ligase] adenylyltransferase [Glaciecola petra]|uniref:Bifunctional glutamine synthetase adenylyltransferase/adenylyl-removing enzyme n=1 Tax=Glaciecola petra TaxID=3075602 RepID=A0ABU2ZNG7_9ALTE|nr:bifunctional [glutamate--ammonia ligase]-adenylyl-L-tyrosine phosphorylase/[glutamate--ammonia-ligase] adenylyltransferase [Aestuariibacter sp. P117]MDT0593588.1 bifunctional [glutamate--ammonia ligase]-adenylyl-L-tyrosine phosphorylase/[glutamate--ammonia-ligase] adenylyltransferase [Aestuariibacter sp. P117]
MQKNLESLDKQFSTQFDSLMSKAEALGLNSQILKSQQSKIRHCFTISPFVARVAEQYISHFIEILQTAENCPDKVSLSQSKDFANKISVCSNDEQAMAIIREYRNTQMLRIVWLDLLHQPTIEQSLIACSALADTIIEKTYEYTYQSLVSRYGEPQDKQQLLILGMGKLGGRELNFSSDIDLIFVYPTNGSSQGPRKPIEHQAFFTRLAQQFIRLLDTRTANGQAYRVDMRLRPLGESGPLVLSFSAFETYYQDQGRHWERFAMQKMRIINKTAFNEKLYAIIKPFVYRKYLDYTTIDAIREMKLLIEKEVRRRQIRDNIKLGKGGIREAEFFIQSIQLIHAGRIESIQTPSFLESIECLCQAELLGKKEGNTLRVAYLYLRKVEQRLQQINDEQTQTLPQDDAGWWRLGKALGANSIDEIKNDCFGAMNTINTMFVSVIGDANLEDVKHEAKNTSFYDIWHLSLSKEECLHILSDTFSQQATTDLYENLTALKKKLNRMGLGAKTLNTLNRLIPLLLSELEIRNNIHQIEGIFKILNTISGRVTYLDLLVEQPDVRKRLLNLCKKSVWISQQIAQYPLLLDELLHPQYLVSDNISLSEYKEETTASLRQSLLRVELADIERVMETLREFKHCNQLRIAAADISGTLSTNKVSDKLTVLAEIIMQQVIEYAWEQISQTFGEPTGNQNKQKNFALIAYGKLGGLELSYGSDLDVVFVHSAALDKMTNDTGRRKAITNQEFYIKLVQRIIHLCTTKTYSGVLYEIDLRLRPSGNSGLLVSHIDTFGDYQTNNAWTWEHQALVRSRAIIGETHLVNRFNEIRRRVLGLKRNIFTLQNDVYDMRVKMREHLYKPQKNSIDLKHAPGGIVDLEFMVQYWVLSHAHTDSQLSIWSDNLRILKTLADLGILSGEQSDELAKCYLTLRHLSHNLQLTGESHANIDDQLNSILERVNLEFNKVFKEK